MRTVTINGVAATIFDEKTHPLGNEFNKEEVAPIVLPVVEKKAVEQEKAFKVEMPVKQKKK
jgi:hypothetical protein